MPIIEDTPEYQIVETITPNGKTTQTINKPGSAGANRDEIETKAAQALAVNATYLALATPTAAQTTAQVKALTRECNALVRLLLGQLDDTAGT